MKTTLRSSVPVLLSEILSTGTTIEFSNDRIHGPIISYSNRELKEGSHYHLDGFIDGVHGGNCLEIEKYLAEILSQIKEKQ
jgi:hypothetical protein